MTLQNTLSHSPIREIERPSASVCNYILSSIIVTASQNENDGTVGWTEEPVTSTTNHTDTCTTPYMSTKEGTTIRISPMERACGGWNEEHFHPHLRVPLPSHPMTVPRGIIVTFDAMARECVAIALSPEPLFILGKTYAIHLGAAFNFNTVIRRRLPGGRDAVEASFPTFQLCSDRYFVPYWVLLQENGHLSVGIGRIPGRHCIGTLDDSMYHQLRNVGDAVKYVGLGNSAIGQRTRDLKVRSVRVMSIPKSFANEVPLLDLDASFLTGNTGTSTLLDHIAHEEVPALWTEYQRQCKKAKTRAVKFGTAYTPPPPSALFNWSDARRLRANPERGFITGLDIMSVEEQEKAKKRKERFGGNNDDCKVVGQEQIIKSEWQVRDKKRMTKSLVSIEEAWDNEEFIEKERVDPPKSLYSKSTQNKDGKNHSLSEVMEMDVVITQSEKVVPEKIHLFAIDWAAFKQIRTVDIIAYFSVYGPSYVEWLGEYSCNVIFEDKFSAARALNSMSQELPTPPPITSTTFGRTTADLGLMGWRVCNVPVRKLSNNQYGRRGTCSRMLLRVASSLDLLEKRPISKLVTPPGFTTKRVSRPGSDCWEKCTMCHKHELKQRRRSTGSVGRSYEEYMDVERCGLGKSNSRESVHKDEPPGLNGCLKCSRC